jgi:N4-gp56 family major capsid protein
MALTTASTLSVNKAAYETIAYYGLRPELYFDQMATFKSTKAAPERGVSVTFTFNNDLAAATTALTDGTDGTAVAMSDSQVTLTPLEYANAVQLTAKNGATAFYELNPVAANIIGFNAGLTMDTLACNAAIAGTKVVYASGTSRATVTKAGTLTGAMVRRGRSYLKNKHVQRFGLTPYGAAYAGIIAPDVVYDFTGATGGTNWSDPQVYGADQSGIHNGVIGKFQGVAFMEVDRDSLMISDAAAGVSCTVQVATSATVSTLTITAHGLAVGDTFTLAGGTATSGTGSTSQVGFNRQWTVVTAADANTVTIDTTGVSNVNAGTATLTSKSVDVYCTLIMGREALGKAFSTGGGYGADPILGDTPVTDLYRRNTGVFWKHFIGYGVIRQDAMYRIESGSSIAL